MAKEDLLEKLVNLDGVSGNEHDVRNFIVKEAKKYVKDVSIDSMGNVIARKKGSKPSIMFLAHMDEVGLMVKGIDKKGKMSISPIGGVDAYILLGQRVDVEAGKNNWIKGIITTNAVLNNIEMTKRVNMEDLYVYTGLNRIELKKKGVDIGSYISFGAGCHYCNLGGGNDYISGKALDDRIGCYALLEVMKKLRVKNEVYFVFTVQEEVGLYGAKASVFNIDPDYAVAIDVTGHDDEVGYMLMGRGPSLTMKDAEMIGNKCLNDHIRKISKKKKIPLQLEVSDFGTTDAASVFASRGGIPSTVMGVSVANLHTSMSVASRKDVDDLVKILKEFIKNPPSKCWS